MKNKHQKLDIVVVGGGLVGSLVSCFLAKRGHSVRIYEYRPDIRVEKLRGVSVNLALSNRGRLALRAVDLEHILVNEHGSAMKGRMLHSKNGSLKTVIYDPVQKNCIYSVDRNFLNQVILNAAEHKFNVKIFFNHKLIDADFDQGRLKFINTQTNEIKEVETQLIIGADGAYSAVRKHMMKKPRFDFSQSYIEHGYVEVTIPPTENQKPVITNNYLHIWPRKNFMMIALPNDNGSFTGNIFAPFKTFESLKSPEELMQFFEEQFPDALPIIDKEQLIDNFFQIKPKTLVSVKCKPYHVGNKVLIIGDAAHAMVPFYAMGMNTGFEDVLLLDELMEKYDSDLEKVLPQFTAKRWKDAQAMCDLAMYNYVEMRDLVTRHSFIARKYLDDFLFWLFPKKWIPLYSTVHFSRLPFTQCIANKEWQDRVIWRIFIAIGLVLFAIVMFYFF